MTKDVGIDLFSYFRINCFLGQNLAREWGKWIENKEAGPEDSVRRWFIEKNYYTFGKFSYPMQSWMCRKEPCGHYTQVSNINIPVLLGKTSYPIWGDKGNAILMNELQLLQNKADKIILSLPSFYSSTEALKELCWSTPFKHRLSHRCHYRF